MIYDQSVRLSSTSYMHFGFFSTKVTLFCGSEKTYFELFV